MTNEEKSSIFYVDLHIAHQQLAHSCLDLVVTELKFNICGLESSYLANKDVEGLEVCIAQHLPPALSYACHLWDDHLKQLDFETDLFEKLQTFFGMKFLFWLEALSLLNGVGLVTFSDYLSCLSYADYHWDCSFPLSQSLHKALTFISVLLHRNLSYHCTIQSDSSIPSLCTVTS